MRAQREAERVRHTESYSAPELLRAGFPSPAYPPALLASDLYDQPPLFALQELKDMERSTRTIFAYNLKCVWCWPLFTAQPSPNHDIVAAVYLYMSSLLERAQPWLGMQTCLVHLMALARRVEGLCGRVFAMELSLHARVSWG